MDFLITLIYAVYVVSWFLFLLIPIGVYTLYKSYTSGTTLVPGILMTLVGIISAGLWFSALGESVLF
jgi:hypothetical protein